MAGSHGGVGRGQQELPPIMSRYLVATPLLNHHHPLVRSTLQRLTAHLKGDDQRAIALELYRYVKDGILFGFSPAFDALSASQVIQAGRGFCNPKSTLFVALLRAAGIPARQHMVSINMNVLQGLGPPTNVYGDHAITEVYLDGRWLRVDSYTVDGPLFKAAQAQLSAEGATMGWGVHKEGVNEWNVCSDSFVQYIMSPGTGVHQVAPDDADAKLDAAIPCGSSSTATHTSVGPCLPGGALSGPDTAFSGQPATPEMPMSDRDFGVIRHGDLSDYSRLVAGSSPFAWQRRWWGRPLFALAASYCNSKIDALRQCAK